MSRKTGPWSYVMHLKDDIADQVMKMKAGDVGTYVYVQVKRNRDGTFDSYNGYPNHGGGSNLEDVSLEEAFSIMDEDFTRKFKRLFATGEKHLYPRRVREMVRNKKINLIIEVA